MMMLAEGVEIMPKKRGQGEGSIRQRPDGTWEARYTVGRNEDGKPIRRSIYGKESEEVKQKLRKILTTIDEGTYIEPSKMTVANWLHTWLWTYKKQSVKAKTFECYESVVRLHIKPELGVIPLRNLRAEHIQKLYNDIAKKLSPRMAQLTHVTLHAALEQAVKNNHIFRNISEMVSLPKKVRKEPRVLTSEEQKKFMQAIVGERLEAAFILNLFAGLRRGEVLGLRWKYIDFKNKLLKVNHTLCRVKTFDEKASAKTKLVFDTPKTDKGRRTIPLLDEVIKVLKAHKRMQSAEKLQAGTAYKDDGIVFCSPLGAPMDPRVFDIEFKRVVAKADIGSVNIHALRHTFATRGLENGIELKVMQELLGHSSIALTGDIYSHVLQDKKREAISKLQGLFEGNQK